MFNFICNTAISNGMDFTSLTKLTDNRQSFHQLSSTNSSNLIDHHRLPVKYFPPPQSAVQTRRWWWAQNYDRFTEGRDLFISPFVNATPASGLNADQAQVVVVNISSAQYNDNSMSSFHVPLILRLRDTPFCSWCRWWWWWRFVS